MNENMLLLGDEAIAQGALDAGISGAYAYPGTPSTEILEYIQQSQYAIDQNIHSLWSCNEKTAMEEALGMSYAGKRTMVCMKHVGLNVAADAFVNSGITGVNGGLVVVVADDPSMHSSQNEQDSRFFAKFAFVPCLEPNNQQNAYDTIYKAFEYSEKVKLPVLLRVTTRLCHSRANVKRMPILDQNVVELPKDSKQFILLPSNARASYAALIDKQKDLIEDSDNSEFNSYTDGENRTLGIITSGIALNYLNESYLNSDINNSKCPHPVLSISQYPLPQQQIAKLFDSCERILVIEEGAPFIEEMLKGILPGNDKVTGRLDGTLPRVGELTPDDVAKALNLPINKPTEIPDLVRIRPPQLCKGCGHIDAYLFLNEVLADFEQSRVFADIGCYTLGALPPYNAIHTTVDMGASVTMAKGAADAGIHPSIAIIGDSTFTHSGITGLLDAIVENTSMTLMILDNDTTAMTGQQESIGSGGKLDKIVAGLGILPEHQRVVIPLSKNHAENMQVLRDEIAYDGISVIIARRPCVHVKRKV